MYDMTLASEYYVDHDIYHCIKYIFGENLINFSIFWSNLSQHLGHFLVFCRLSMDLEALTALGALLQKVVHHSDCHIYTGTVKWCRGAPYGWTDRTIKGTRYRRCAHQVALMVAWGMPQLPSDGQEVSHLCHNSLCVNPVHLSYEPHHVNNNRTLCMHENHCFGHGQYPACLIDCRLPGGGMVVRP